MIPTGSRRDILGGLLATTGTFAMPARAQAQTAPTMSLPACDGSGRPTRSQLIEPYFRPWSPRRRNLVTASRPGERVSLSGFVLSRRCQPIEGALVELWHADANGAYDNVGTDLHGIMLTDPAGRWWFETIVPGLNAGRTRHYNIKVQAPGWRALTTRLYFPDEPANARDPTFDRALVMQVQRYPDGRIARFDIVLNLI